ncbi:MAG: hypothetical protein LAKADJCE_00617 [Candidatus Argoarchaeum ethanivorans]|uniref:Uncharacterized protein n=1 Tax=Candidatus Argoarchaeum ethanivorans TaxID=2608793 RepID=A0A811TEB7_9EURY|nr:MAG: hypothetical protein LAKADJCE_00617 [Candidatus Argoarchaeum ethanivorans]
MLWSYEIDGKVSISSDGSYIASVSGGYSSEDHRPGKVCLFDREGELLWSYEIYCDEFAYASGVSTSSDGSYIAAGFDSWRDDAGHIYLFNREGELLWSYETAARVSISSDGSYIASGSVRSGDGKVCLFDREGELLWSYRADDLVREVSISPDGSYIAAESKYSKFYLFGDLERHSFSAIGEAKKVVESERMEGFNMDEAETLLSNAEDAFDTGNYVKASELANAAKDRGESIPNEASAAENAIAEVESAIHQEESKGFNPVEAESLLSQAEEAFSTGEYIKASELADKAKDHALDIDQDGVSNDADFAPTINNYLIYAGAAILLVVLVIAIITGLKAIQRFKLERERNEERRRERLRQEAEERRRMIQKIIDKIKEVT